MLEALVDSRGANIPMANIKRMSWSRRQDVMAAVWAQIETARPGQAVLFHMMGHGSPFLDEYDDAAMTFPLGLEDDNGLELTDILALYELAEQRGVRLVSVIDTCGAGAFANGLRNSVIRQLENTEHVPGNLQALARIHQAVWALRHWRENMKWMEQILKDPDDKKGKELPAHVMELLYFGYQARDEEGRATRQTFLEHVLANGRTGPFLKSRDQAAREHWHELPDDPDWDDLSDRDLIKDGTVAYMTGSGLVLRKISHAWDELTEAIIALDTGEEQMARYPRLARMLEQPLLAPRIKIPIKEEHTIEALDAVEDALNEQLKEIIPGFDPP
jgi:hypothetical protein